MATITDVVTLKLSLQQLNTVLLALGDQPYRVAADIISEIRGQAQQQIKPRPQEYGDQSSD